MVEFAFGLQLSHMNTMNTYIYCLYYRSVRLRIYEYPFSCVYFETHIRLVHSSISELWLYFDLSVN